MGYFDVFSYGFNNYSYTPSLFTGFGGVNSYTPIFNFGGTNYSSNYSYSGLSFASGSNSYDFSFLNASPSIESTSSRRTSFGSLSSSTRRASGGRKYCGIGSEYGRLSKSVALQKASNDSRLEFIGNGGNGWSISDASFRNDIKYATSGTSRVLDEVVAEVRKKDPNFSLLVTSALGTASSPHGKNAGHYNVANVKLDFGGGMSKAQANKVANQLQATGKFDFADPECDGATWHIDAQIKKEYLA